VLPSRDAPKKKGSLLKPVTFVEAAETFGRAAFALAEQTRDGVEKKPARITFRNCIALGFNIGATPWKVFKAQSPKGSCSGFVQVAPFHFGGRNVDDAFFRRRWCSRTTDRSLASQ
jgi:hypothetical protein